MGRWVVIRSHSLSLSFSFSLSRVLTPFLVSIRGGTTTTTTTRVIMMVSSDKTLILLHAWLMEGGRSVSNPFLLRTQLERGQKWLAVHTR